MHRTLIPCLLIAGMISACSSSDKFDGGAQTPPAPDDMPGTDTMVPAPEVDPTPEVEPTPVEPTSVRDLATDFPDDIQAEVEVATIWDYLIDEAGSALVSINQNVSQGSTTEADLNCIMDSTMSTIVTSIMCDPARPVRAGMLDFAIIDSPDDTCLSQIMNDNSASLCNIQNIQIVTDFGITVELDERDILALRGFQVDPEIDASSGYTCFISTLSGSIGLDSSSVLFELELGATDGAIRTLEFCQDQRRELANQIYNIR